MLEQILLVRDQTSTHIPDRQILIVTTLIGIGMRSCLYFLCKNPEIYKAVQQEVDNYYDSKQLQSPITYQQTQELPLLCACVREAIRLFPSITYPLLRYAPAGLEVDEQAIPAGTAVGVSVGAANRNVDVWGTYLRRCY